MNHTELINKAVKDSLEKFLKTQKNRNNNIRIKGKVPDMSKYIFTYDSIDTNRIDEGLIKTYPPQKTKDYVIRKYDLDDNQVQIQPIDNGIMTTEFICIIVPKSIDNNTIGSIKHDMKTCGYFLNRPQKQIENTPYIGLVFEPKFSKDISDIVREKYKYLYHSAPKIYLESIKEKGLVPKSKNSLFLYPDRTFLMTGDWLTNTQVNALKNIQDVRSRNANRKNPKERMEYILIKLQVSKLPPDIKLYCDPMTQDAIFTYDNIPPNAIIDIRPFTL